MASRPVDPDEALAGPLYLLAILLVLMPVVDYTQSLGGVHPRDLQWRFASVGLLSNFLVTPLLGVALALIVAAVREHLTTARVVSIMALVSAAILAVLVCAFVLDVLQLRLQVPPERLPGFTSAAARAILKHLMGALALAWLGLRGLRIARWRPRTGERRSAPATGA